MISHQQRNDMVVKAKINEKDIASVINKGAEVVEDQKKQDEWTTICLRLPKKMLEEIDQSCAKQIGLSRNAYLLQLLRLSIQAYR